MLKVGSSGVFCSMGIIRLLSIPVIVLILHQIITGFIAKVVCYGYLLETTRRDDFLFFL